MDPIGSTLIWPQLGAAIAMLANALDACPEALWCAQLWDDPTDRPEYGQYWYRIYHTLFWLDLYLDGQAAGFAPPAPFGVDDTDGISPRLPDTPYSKAELRDYLEACRRKCQATLAAMTPAQAQRLCRFEWGEMDFAQLQLYSMRHVQEHAAQLHMLLGQRVGAAPDWVGQVDG